MLVPEAGSAADRWGAAPADGPLTQPGAVASLLGWSLAALGHQPQARAAEELRQVVGRSGLTASRFGYELHHDGSDRVDFSVCVSPNSAPPTPEPGPSGLRLSAERWDEFDVVDHSPVLAGTFYSVLPRAAAAQARPACELHELIRLIGQRLASQPAALPTADGDCDGSGQACALVRELGTPEMAGMMPARAHSLRLLVGIRTRDALAELARSLDARGGLADAETRLAPLSALLDGGARLRAGLEIDVSGATPALGPRLGIEIFADHRSPGLSRALAELGIDERALARMRDTLSKLPRGRLTGWAFAGLAGGDAAARRELMLPSHVKVAFADGGVTVKSYVLVYNQQPESVEDRLEARLLRNGWAWPDRLVWAAHADQARPGETAREPDPGAASSIDTTASMGMTQWAQAVDPDGVGNFAKRLRWAGLDEQSARTALRPPYVPATIRPFWRQELWMLRDACIASAAGPADTDAWLSRLDKHLPGDGSGSGSEDIPFAHLLWPLVDSAWERLTPLAPAAIDQISPQARSDLQRSLLNRLAGIAGQALLEGFEAALPAGERMMRRLGSASASEAASRSRYASFCREHLRDGLARLLTEYPVLGRLLATASAQWRSNSAQLLGRLLRDGPVLQSAFAIPPGTQITRIRGGLSDSHRGGQSVAVIWFGSTAVVYKPKDVRLERHYQQVAALVAQHLPGAPLRTLTVVDRPGESRGLPAGPRNSDRYGYVEHVPHEPGAGDTEVAAFYRNAGRVLALLHLLGGTDCHLENLIAHRDQLMLVDAETLFEGRVATFVDDPAAISDASTGRLLNDSVLRTALLPMWRWLDSQQQAIELSALGAQPGSGAPARAPGWSNTNTDAMAFATRMTVPQHPASLPVGPGAQNPLREHVEDLVAGFGETYRLMMQPAFRRELADLIGGFAGVARRIVIRDTRIYWVLRDRAQAPASLRSATRRAAELEKLARSYLLSAERPAQWPILSAEQRALEELDIPYFDHPLGSRDLILDDATVVADVVSSDGLTACLDRLSALSEQDLQWQVRLMRASIEASGLRMDQPSAFAGASVAPMAAALPASPADEAGEIFHVISKSAIADEAGVPAWLTLSVMPDGIHTKLGLIEPGLYDGRAGVAAFLLAFGAAQQDPAQRAQAIELARAALSPICRVLDSDDSGARLRYLRDLGLGLTGVGGLLRVFHLAALAGGEPDQGWDRYQAKLIESAAALVDKDRAHDLIWGCAGLIRPVSRCLTEMPDTAAASLLRAAAESLLESQDRATGGQRAPWAKRPLTGLSHGASGMAVALFEAAAALRDEQFLAAGLSALAYERQVFDSGAGNWPDFRFDADGQAFMTSWCHGAPGIALARMRILQLFPDHSQASRWAGELQVAAATTLATPVQPKDHLCCGNLGRAAILRTLAASDWGQPEWAVGAADLTDLVLQAKAARGHFGLPTAAGPAREGSNLPGLMTGLAGIGLHLLDQPARPSGLADLLL